MTFEKLFEIVDYFLGSRANLKGLTFELDNGVLIVDYFDTGHENDFMFICDYIPNEGEAQSFAAKGLDELKEQFEYYLQ